VIGFIADSLLLLPFLFVTYLGLEAIESKAGGALARILGRVHFISPVLASAAGAVPQCGFSAAAASLYAGGAITLGTLLSVFLSTSDELVPVLLGVKGVPASVVFKIVAIKTVVAALVGLTVNTIIYFTRGSLKIEPRVDELCSHSRSGCHHRRGIVVPALIHTMEIFVFIFVISAAIELVTHFLGESWMLSLSMNKPFVGELIGAGLGLIPNCAASVASAQMYAGGAMSAGALMASSFAGCGVGFLVLFRARRGIVNNLFILLLVYVIGVVAGYLTGGLL
jgi:hypothetical protein